MLTFGNYFYCLKPSNYAYLSQAFFMSLEDELGQFLYITSKPRPYKSSLLPESDSMFLKALTGTAHLCPDMITIIFTLKTFLLLLFNQIRSHPPFGNTQQCFNWCFNVKVMRNSEYTMSSLIYKFWFDKTIYRVNRLANRYVSNIWSLFISHEFLNFVLTESVKNKGVQIKYYQIHYIWCMEYISIHKK